MLKQAIEYLMNAGKTEVLDIGNQKYSTKALNLVREPQPNALETSTLTGVVDYIVANIDGISGRLLVQISSFNTVHVLGPLRGDMARNYYISCEAETPNICTDDYLDIERFNVMLQSCFLPSADRENVLKIIGNIKEENVKNTGDDGISQTITAKVGIARVDDVILPNPVTLVPFKTFTEVPQPEIKYVFRMKDGPRAGLFVADGGAWKLKTIEEIKGFLKEKLEGLDVEIIA